MPIITTQRKRQRTLIGVMIGVFVITGVVLYLGIFRGGGQDTNLPIDTGPLLDSLPALQGFVLDTSILSEERFRRLVPYAKLPADIKTGRDNPFIPYEQ